MLRLPTVALGMVFSFVLISVAANDRAVPPPAGQPAGRLLTRNEGTALISGALENPEAKQAPDCSHLVHQLLTSAGLVYPYATSFQIFRGIPHFRQVSRAQPGDLIVWPGHVGLVVDPDQRTFFSRTGSGPRTDEYTSDYWRTRGHPRFYRYLVTDDNHIAEQLYVAQTTPPSSTADPEHSSMSSDEADVIASEPATPSRPDPVPENIQIFAERGRPAKEDVEEGLSELGNASASALESDRQQRLLVALVRDLRVDKLQVKGNKGWADVYVESRAEISPDLKWKRARPQTIRWELRRDRVGWLLVAPKDRLYIPQSAAVPLLAKQLSTLSAAPVPSGRQRQLGSLASLLNFLLNEN